MTKNKADMSLFNKLFGSNETGERDMETSYQNPPKLKVWLTKTEHILQLVITNKKSSDLWYTVFIE